MFTTQPPYSKEYGGASVPPPAGSIRTGARAQHFMASMLRLIGNSCPALRQGEVQRLKYVPPLVPPIACRAEAAGRLDVPLSKSGLLDGEADRFVAASGLREKS